MNRFREKSHDSLECFVCEESRVDEVGQPDMRVGTSKDMTGQAGSHRINRDQRYGPLLCVGHVQARSHGRT